MLPSIPQKLNKTSKALANKTAAVIEAKGYAADYVQHLGIDEVRAMVAGMKERDRLLITFIFDTCFRASEAISIRPCDIKQTNDGWQINVLGKGGKRSVVAVSASMVAQIQSYAYRNNIGHEQRIFSIDRTRVFQIVQKAMRSAGIAKPDGVGAAHILRHSGALERLRRTGNPKAVQDQLRHSSAAMTLRYMKTLSQKESLSIQSGVDYKW